MNTESSLGCSGESTSRWLVRCGIRYVIVFALGWVLVAATFDRPHDPASLDFSVRLPFWESFLRGLSGGWGPLLIEGGQSLVILGFIARHRHQETAGSFRLRAGFLLIFPLWPYVIFTPLTMLLILAGVQVIFAALIMPLGKVSLPDN
ncbi:hypothetical protein ACFVTP_16425 [Streptomyces celluloflavus]|uniref:hypothetical protein n=1 Tax=Streptomyces celluloflavus TaxID=58344 RepID=UPI0036D8DF2E